MLRPIVRDMQGHANEAAARLDGHHLFALEGILPGFFNASEATRWKPGRSAMVRDAVAERSAGLARVWEVRRQQAQEEIPPVAPEQADDAAVVEESGPSESQEQVQDQAQDQGGDMEVQQSETLASVAGISTSTDAQLEAGPLVQGVEAA
jgi:hypothetical protein